jgi:radical SAM protein with 4Fe4S-binding SPASM domain
VSPCVFLHQLKVGDLLTEELRDIVGRPEFLALAARRSQVPAACRDRDCPLLQACRGGCAARTLLHGTSREGPHDPPGNPGIAADLWAALHRPDPFCPADAIDAGNPDAAPLPCTLEVARESLRIHDGYLCTYIGTPRREPAWSAAPDDGDPAAAPAPVARPRPEPFRRVA